MNINNLRNFEKIKTPDRIFDNDVLRNINDPDWNCRMVSWVFSRIREERKNKVINIASAVFPLLASAFLIFILKYGDAELSGNTDIDNDVYTMIDTEESHPYDIVDYYMEMFVSQR